VYIKRVHLGDHEVEIAKMLSPSHPNVDPFNHSVPILDVLQGGIYNKKASSSNIDSTSGIQDQETNTSEGDGESVGNYGITEADSSPTIDPTPSKPVTYDIDDVYIGDNPKAKMNTNDNVEDDERIVYIVMPYLHPVDSHRIPWGSVASVVNFMEQILQVGALVVTFAIVADHYLRDWFTCTPVA
jgi:hypothetical protein